MTAAQTTEKASITARLAPCRCGCGGRDSWHAKQFIRTVREIIEIEPTSAKAKSGYAITIDARGIATFPWGASAVGRQVTRNIMIGWVLLAEDPTDKETA